jgi:hypothetical protein
LRRVPFFSGLPEDILAAIAGKLRREHYVKDDVVFVQGGLEVMESEIIKIGMNPANVVIRPAVENISAQEFERARDLIQLGEDAANRALDQIKQLFVPLPRERAR